MYNYAETKESTSNQYLQYGWALSQLILQVGSEQFKDNSMLPHDFITNYNKNSDFDYTTIVDADYPEYFQPLPKDLPFLPEKTVINEEEKQHVLFTVKGIIDDILDYSNKF